MKIKCSSSGLLLSLQDCDMAFVTPTLYITCSSRLSHFTERKNVYNSWDTNMVEDWIGAYKSSTFFALELFWNVGTI